MTDDKQFKREGSHKKKAYPDRWRSPEGTHSKVRLEKKGAPAKPKDGYRTERELRGRHPSGYREVRVHRPADLSNVDPEEEAVRIASKVGRKKREDIIERAENDGIHVLNRGEEE